MYKKYETIGNKICSKTLFLTETDITTSLVAKKYAFWYARSQFWTHGGPFREHFHFIYFFILTPVSLMVRLFGKDLIGMKSSKEIKSYWVKRKNHLGSMDKQF